MCLEWGCSVNRLCTFISMFHMGLINLGQPVRHVFTDCHKEKNVCYCGGVNTAMSTGNIEISEWMEQGGNQLSKSPNKIFCWSLFWRTQISDNIYNTLAKFLSKFYQDLCKILLKKMLPPPPPLYLEWKEQFIKCTQPPQWWDKVREIGKMLWQEVKKSWKLHCFPHCSVCSVSYFMAAMADRCSMNT